MSAGFIFVIFVYHLQHSYYDYYNNNINFNIKGILFYPLDKGCKGDYYKYRENNTQAWRNWYTR